MFNKPPLSGVEPCILAGLLLMTCLAPASLAQSSLPQLGDGEEMSLAAERKLGAHIARDIYRDPDYLDDPLLAAYVHSIWHPLLEAARARGEITPEQDQRFAWQIMLARDKTINAFALPGGYLGVHLGLIAIVSNRDELASVLAHELSHVTQRHIARITTQQSKQAPWLLGGLILGVLAARKNPDAANAVIASSQAVGAQTQLNFSRDMEREADRIGYLVLQDAGFAVQGFVGMFDKLAQANRINDSGSFPYLRTHPLTSERIGDMQARMQLSNGPRTNLATKAADDRAPKARLPDAQTLAAEHAIFAARARVLADATPDNLRAELVQARAIAAASPAPGLDTMRTLGQLYAGTLAALKLRELVDAQILIQSTRQHLKSIVNSAESHAEYAQAAIDLLASEVAVAQGNFSQATRLLQPHLQAGLIPTQAFRPALLLWAQALHKQHAVQPNPAELAQAGDRLQAWVASHPNDAQAWEALANIYTVQGKSLRAIRAQAESRVALLDYSAALDRLKAGQTLAKAGAGHDHIESSIIDVRTRTVQAQLRDWQKDKPAGL